jgi:membrane protease YdiL (CAAX protease family)
MTERAIWCEVAAVLAIGVVPKVSTAIVAAVEASSAPLPYWLDSLDLCVRSVCTSFVVLYLIGRSGEAWSTFGLVRPGFSDLVLGLVLVAADLGLWWRVEPLLPGEVGQNSSIHPTPGHTADYFLMLLKHAANGFAEELVVRAYLITRLERLLGSSLQAVVLSAVAFASYHLYYGPGAGLIYMALLGLMFGAFYLVVRRVWPFALGHMLINVYIEMQLAPP